MNEKLIFTKPSAHRSRSDKYPTIRVNAQLYDTLTSIADTTGLSIATVANRMIEFAVNHTEIVDCYPATLNKANCCVVYGG